MLDVFDEIKKNHANPSGDLATDVTVTNEGVVDTVKKFFGKKDEPAADAEAPAELPEYKGETRSAIIKAVQASVAQMLQSLAQSKYIPDDLDIDGIASQIATPLSDYLQEQRVYATKENVDLTASEEDAAAEAERQEQEAAERDAAQAEVEDVKRDEAATEDLKRGVADPVDPDAVEAAQARTDAEADTNKAESEALAKIEANDAQEAADLKALQAGQTDGSVDPETVDAATARANAEAETARAEGSDAYMDTVMPAPAQDNQPITQPEFKLETQPVQKQAPVAKKPAGKKLAVSRKGAPAPAKPAPKAAPATKQQATTAIPANITAPREPGVVPPAPAKPAAKPAAKAPAPQAAPAPKPKRGFDEHGVAYRN